MAQPVVQGVVLGAANESGCSSTAEDATYKAAAVDFSDAVPPGVRNGFIRKVYALLTLMLIMTTVVAVPFHLFAEPIKEHLAVLQALMWGSLITALLMCCCCMQLMRRYPTNYVFLFVFALLYGVIVGAVTIFYTLPSVLLAAGITAAMFLMLTAYACLTKTDFTGLGPYLVCALLGLIVFGFMALFVSYFCSSCYSLMNVIYAAVGAVLFSMYIVYDTQLIVGGRHRKHQFSVDDFAFAALSLYMDVINLFLMILSLFGNRSN